MGTILELNELTVPELDDLFLVRDVSDLADKDKKIRLNKFGLLNHPQTWAQPQDIVTSNANSALLIQQNGAGAVFDLFDGATRVMRVQDGGQLDVFGTVRALTATGLSLQDVSGNLGVRVFDGGGVALRRNTMVTLANLQLSAGVFAEPAISVQAPAVADHAEIIQTWSVSDNTGDYFSISNAIPTNGRFAASLSFRNTTASPETFAIGYETLPATDTGTEPCIMLSALRRTSGQAFTAIATRPILEVRNMSKMVFKIWASDAVSIPYVFNTTGSGSNVVVVDSNGTLAKVSSSLRYKRNVRDLDAGKYGDDFLMKLRPILYKDKTKHLDGMAVAYGKDEDSRDFAGLIAEEVDTAGGKEFILFDDDGKPDSLMYDRLVAPLIGAVQRLLKRVELLEQANMKLGG